MTPEQLQELEEKAKLWDELSHVLHKLLTPIKQHKEVVFDSKPISEYKSTIQNLSNAKTHIDLLQEESKEMIDSSSWFFDKEIGRQRLYVDTNEIQKKL